jgi:hypothetical protein
MLQHAVGHRVVVADNRIAQLQQQVCGRDPQRFLGVVDTLFQEIDAGCPGMILDELIEAGFEALGLGIAPEVRHVGERAFGLAQGKQPQLEKPVARGGGNPVGIAPSSVQHHAFVVALGQFDQLVLDLERAQLVVF